MARILLFPFPLLSHYLRCLSLAGHLPNHELVFAGPADHRHYATERGYDYQAFKTFDPLRVIECGRNFNFKWINEPELEAVMLAQCEVIRNIKPDLVISDATVTSKVAAQLSGVPLITLQNAYLSRFYKRKKSVPAAFPAKKILPESMLKPAMPLGEKLALRTVHKPFKNIRKRFKLPATTSLSDEWEGDHTFLCDLEVLFPQEKLPATFSWLGPLYHDDRTSGNEFVPGPDPAKKTIVVCLGSSGREEDVAFLNTPEYENYNIIAAGNIFSSPLAHIIQKPFINLSTVLPSAHLLICHGGNGTVYLGLEAGVAILAFPSFFEQEWFMQGVEENNLGWIVPQDSSKKDQVIHDLLSSPREGNESISQSIVMKRQEQGAILRRKIDELLQSKV